MTMMNLDTKYLNMTLHSPLVVSASPLSQSLDNIKQMEDAGASAIVLYSLFEEQIRVEQQMLRYFQEHPAATATDALALFPARKQFPGRVDDYLEHISKSKSAVAIPIIASLNCKSLGSWTDLAAQIESAGASAIELNIYSIPTNMEQPTVQIEDMVMSVARIVKEATSLPVAVKLPPYFTNMAAMARRLDGVGANALVLFNRYYQPDFDPRTLELRSDVPFGNPSDLRLSMHWIATLFGRLKADMGATGGIYSGEDVVKLLMVGAKVTMLASALLRHGIDHLHTVREQLQSWMEQNDYESVHSMQGILRQFHSRDSAAFERAKYISALKSLKVDE